MKESTLTSRQKSQPNNNRDDYDNSKSSKSETQQQQKQNSYIVIIGLILIFVVSYLYFSLNTITTATTTTTTDNIENQSKSIQVGLKKIALWSKNNGNCGDYRVAVGYNTNLDLVVDAIELLNSLELNASPNPIPSDQISTLSQFEQTFTYYFDSGSAAERFINEKALFDQIIKATNTLKRKEYLTGGNAGIIANRLAREGCTVDLSGVVGSKLKSLLNSSINVVDYNAETPDEIHLIMEYHTDSKWGSYSTHRANRFIISNDLSNSNIVTMEKLHHHLQHNSKQHKTDLLIISGLHLLGDQQINRIQDMSKLLDIIPYQAGKESFLSVNNIPIHFELASITSSQIIKSIANQILPKVDSLGFNEQELGFLYLATGGNSYTMADFKVPSINTVVDAIIHIFEKLSPPSSPTNVMEEEKRTLTRIHFHYLTYHIVATKKDSHWSSKRSAMSVAASSIEASDQACSFNDVELRIPLAFQVDYRYTPGSKLKFTIDVNNPVTTWKDADIEFHLAPVLVCKSPERTVGLGDSISTAGFIYQTIKYQ